MNTISSRVQKDGESGLISSACSEYIIDSNDSQSSNHHVSYVEKTGDGYIWRRVILHGPLKSRN
jgi:hypothetical protein